ncbi:DUF4251 domain-containing protein [Changchengzhania lutea]|uniref:DUF4251 domain-containing protein n=1 Tax=Changchengzhania lutea TaxID=2049305 RepID=UPI00115D1394|nr:DUF4251 domain-containing protein [Changchengzhania lutea]
MKKILITLIVFGIVSCGSSFRSTKKTSEALDAMVSNKRFKIVSTSAQPQVTNAMQQLGNTGIFGPGNTAGNISLIGNANFLTMTKDSVMAYLPYYGERQFGGGYSNKTGIEFAGIPKGLQITKGQKSDYAISFKIDDKNSRSENYQIYIKLFPNLTSTIDINSTQRFNIRYSGTVDSLTVEK